MAAQFAHRFLVLVHISTRTDVSQKGTIQREARNSGVINPAICFIIATEPIFHPEIHPRVKVANVSFEAAIQILRMNALQPTIAEFLVNVAASEIQPRAVEPNALFILT